MNFPAKIGICHFNKNSIPCITQFSIIKRPCASILEVNNLNSDWLPISVITPRLLLLP